MLFYKEYERIKKLGDKLVEIGSRINWEGFRPWFDEQIEYRAADITSILIVIASN